MATGFGGMMKQVQQPRRTYQTVNENVQDAIAGVMDKGGALMQRAETRGRATASRSGLLNSSMAVGAAQGAVIDAATPIGAQQAQQNFQRNENERAYGRQTESEIRAINQQRELQDDDQAFTGGQAGLDRQQQLTVQRNDQTFAGQQAGLDRTLQRDMQRADFGFQGQQAGLDRASRERLEREERALQERIANMNIDAADREGVARMIASGEQVYAQQIAAIMSNTNMSAEDREAMLRSIESRRNLGIDLTEIAYGVRIDLDTPGLTEETRDAQNPAPQPTPGPTPRPAAAPTQPRASGNTGLNSVFRMRPNGSSGRR